MTMFKSGPGDNLTVTVTTDNDTYLILGSGQFNDIELGTHTGDTVIRGNGDNDIVKDFGLATPGDLGDPSNNTIILGNGAHDSVELFQESSNSLANGDHVTVGNGDFDALNDQPEAQHTNNSVITFGNGNNDVLQNLGSGNVVTVGGGNSDSVSFSGDHNTVTLGNGNNDVVASGGAGNTITVGNGNDTIHVGMNDTVTVGKGQDTFVFDTSAQEQPGGIGAVTITGFQPGKDVIKIQTTLATSFNATDDAHGNAVVTFPKDGLDQITLVGVHSSALHASDIQFA
jgi:hypothetical protein